MSVILWGAVQAKERSNTLKDTHKINTAGRKGKQLIWIVKQHAELQVLGSQSNFTCKFQYIQLCLTSKMNWGKTHTQRNQTCPQSTFPTITYPQYNHVRHINWPNNIIRLTNLFSRGTCDRMSHSTVQRTSDFMMREFIITHLKKPKGMLKFIFETDYQRLNATKNIQ